MYSPNENNIVVVTILGKCYKVKCPPEQAKALQESARVLEDKLHDMKQGATNVSTDRMLVVTALNLCHELQTLKSERTSYVDTIQDKLHGLQSRIQSFITAEDELCTS